MTSDLDTATATSPAAPALRRRGPGGLAMVVAIAGPGLIAVNAGNDAAGIATYASAGSQYTYGTVSFMVLVTITLVMVQEVAVRLGAHTARASER